MYVQEGRCIWMGLYLGYVCLSEIVSERKKETERF